MSPHAIWAVALVVGPAGVRADVRITFARIVDTQTAAPGSPGTFNSFAPPALDNGTIAFWGQAETGTPGLFDSGIFIFDDPLKLVANNHTPMPGAPAGIGNFVELTPPTLGAGGGTFSGFGVANWQGVYSWDQNLALSIVADRTTPDPGGQGTLVHFFLASRGGQESAFSAFTLFFLYHGIYRNDGQPALVANYDTPIPDGTGTFTMFEPNVTIGDGLVAFVGRGAGDQSGVYLGASGLAVVADRSTPIPGGTGTFTDFGDRPITDGGRVAFHGSQIDYNPYQVVQDGVYTDVGGQLRVVADLDTPIPDGAGTFTSFGYGGIYGFTLNNGRVVFRGNGNGGQHGIYVQIADQLIKVVDLNTQLETGLALAHLNVNHQCLDGNRLGFLAEFTLSPGQFYRALYMATLILPGDFEADGDVDLTDLAAFVPCLAGPGGGLGADCDPGDIDHDQDVDLEDVAAFQRLFSGPQTPG